MILPKLLVIALYLTKSKVLHFTAEYVGYDTAGENMFLNSSRCSKLKEHNEICDDAGKHAQKACVINHKVVVWGYAGLVQAIQKLISLISLVMIQTASNGQFMYGISEGKKLASISFLSNVSSWFCIPGFCLSFL